MFPKVNQCLFLFFDCRLFGLHHPPRFSIHSKLIQQFDFWVRFLSIAWPFFMIMYPWTLLSLCSYFMICVHQFLFIVAFFEHISFLSSFPFIDCLLWNLAHWTGSFFLDLNGVHFSTFICVRIVMLLIWFFINIWPSDEFLSHAHIYTACAVLTIALEMVFARHLYLLKMFLS